MANKKTQARKTAPKATEPAEQDLEPFPPKRTETPDSPDEPDAEPELESGPADDIEDPVANAISILSATDVSGAIEAMTTVGMSDAIDSLSPDKPDSPRNAVRYLESYVASHPDIDAIVDRGTERAALLGFQASKSGRDTNALETFLRRRWDLPVATTPPGKHAWPSPPPSPPAEQPPVNPLAGLVQRPRSSEGWIPEPQGSNLVATEAFPPVRHQGYDEAFEQARQEGYFGGSAESGETRE